MVFRPAGPDTRIEYSVEIKAELPRRRELNWMPPAMVKQFAEDRIRHRLREITAALITRSLAEFR